LLKNLFGKIGVLFGYVSKSIEFQNKYKGKLAKRWV